eukprot:TRINITY_DN4983_c0_g1_i1.p1 TRINITY_DN4983_c0_g1~~TRINITY_DN4983_c0_g1_i1.p1  ORF type:complete len:380 (-),score=35.13 TRINITY_DN4983_c0_g1_i1:225-1364(-)
MRNAENGFTEEEHKRKLLEGNFFNGETIQFIQKQAYSPGMINQGFIYVVWTICTIVLIANIIITVNIIPHWALCTIALVVAFIVMSFYLTYTFAFDELASKALALTNYRILLLSEGTWVKIVSLPYSNVEMEEWKEDGLKFWFSPNKFENGGRPHIKILGLSAEEKLRVQELFLQGKTRNLSSFKPLSPLSPKYECSKEISHVVQDHLPLLWEHKLSDTSPYSIWVKVLILGFLIASFLIGGVPGVMLGMGYNTLHICIVTAIIVLCWVLAIIFVRYSRTGYFAITENSLLKIELRWRGTCVESLPFHKVYPIFNWSVYYFTRANEQNGSRTNYDLKHYFPTAKGFFIAGPSSGIVQREEIIFRKYLDTLKDVSTVECV